VSKLLSSKATVNFSAKFFNLINYFSGLYPDASFPATSPLIEIVNSDTDVVSVYSILLLDDNDTIPTILTLSNGISKKAVTLFKNEVE